MRFQSVFVDALPGDPIELNRSRQVRGACYSRVLPTAVSHPKVLSHSKDLAHQLGIASNWFESEQAAQVLSGSSLLPGMSPYAMCYGGHQFGNWAGQLGDGRAINLGEWIATDKSSWTWQLKGAGKTPYSRFGDGLAVLRSSLREYLCSEAMHYLGVPTTRALSLVTTGELVTRDMFYDGNPRREPGAIVCRVAPSFLRFGNYEILAAQQDVSLLKKLVDFTIEKLFPELRLPSPEVYEAWFREVCIRTARMIIHWMRVGFVHGVMNTDNMSILGLTIDYGPYGWIDNYDSGWTPNTTDSEGRRYCFGDQPQVAQWNLVQLANSLVPLFETTEPLQRGLDAYVETIRQEYLEMQFGKLGFGTQDNDACRKCVEDLEALFAATEIDMTLFYRLLANIDSRTERNSTTASELESAMLTLKCAFYQWDSISDYPRDLFATWLAEYLRLIRYCPENTESRRMRMNRINPKYVLRNYMAQQAIDAAEQGDTAELETLMVLLKHPYDEQPEFERYFSKRPDWARTRAGCSMLSCSS